MLRQAIDLLFPLQKLFIFFSFFSELSGDVVAIVFLTLSSIISVLSIALFVEEIIFLHGIHYENATTRVRKLATILGLFPVSIG